MRRISIRTLLALSIGGLVLIATGSVLWIAVRANTTNTIELLNSRMVLVLDGIENEVRDKLDSAASMVEGVAAEMETTHFRAAATDEVLDALTVVLATAPEVDVLVYWDRNFVRRGVYRDKDGSLKRLSPQAETDPRVRKRLSAIPADSRYLWGEPVVDNGETYLNVVARVAARGVDVAYVGAAASLTQFSRFVTEVGRKYEATAFMLYGRNYLLAHPSLDVENGEPGMGLGVIPVSESRDPVIANLAKGVAVSYAGQARAQGIEVERIDVDENVYLAMFRWVDGYGPEAIAVGAYYPRTEISDTLERLMMSAVAGLTVVVIAVIAAFVLGGFIARPVRRLADSASAVARLELADASRPAASAIAELDQQARAFNLMLDGLRVFETYVPRQLVQRLVELGGQHTVASEAREVTVMFTDIAGFTAIADRMGAEETAAFLNRHFGILADCIAVESGTIDKYIGDAIMAFWGAPDRMEDHAARAVAAARRIARTVTADNRRRANKGLKPVRVRIGMHSGNAVVGNIGAPGRVNYTMVGDTVNVAQRIESLGHKLDTGADVTVLMSARTARQAGVGSEGEDVGEHALAGVPHPVAVVRLHTHVEPTLAAPPEAEPAAVK